MSEFDDKRSQNDGQDEQSGSVYSYSYSDINQGDTYGDDQSNGYASSQSNYQPYGD